MGRPAVILLLGLFLAACQAGQGVLYTDNSPPRDPADGPVNVTVLANAAKWRDSGVTIRPGNVYHVNASGRWSAHGVCPFTGPDGIGAYSGLCYNTTTNRVLMSATHPTLIGKIGENGSVFAVGSSRQIRSTNEGTLYLRMNDDEFSTANNRGSVSATITLSSSERAPAAPVVQSAVVKKVMATVAPKTTANTSGDFPAQAIALNFQQAAVRPDDVAVIIGNANYGQFKKGIPNVTPAYADAEGFKQYATQALGVREGNIIYLRDATNGDFTSVFGTERNHRGKLFNWTRPGISNVYVYYAGHGAPAGSDGSAYLLPADADADTLELTGYRLETLYKNLAKIPAKSITVVLESCFSGRAEGGAVISRASPIFTRAKPLVTPANMTVISAGSDQQMASWEKDKSHGLFTKYFLLGMSGKADAKPYGDRNGKVSYTELKDYLAHTLTYYARRHYGREQAAQIVVGH